MFNLSLSALSSKLLQPTSIAVMASIAIHSAIAVAFPDVAIIPEPEKRTRKRTVRLISIESGRLPNLSQSFPKVPDFPQTPPRTLPSPSPTTPQASKIVTPSTPSPVNPEILSLQSPKEKPSPSPSPKAIIPSPSPSPSPSPLQEKIRNTIPENPPKSQWTIEQEKRDEELVIQRKLEEDVEIDPRITAERQPADQPLKYPFPAITGEEIEQLLPPPQPEEEKPKEEIEIALAPTPTPTPTLSPTPTPISSPSTDISDNWYITPNIDDLPADLQARAYNLKENLIDTTDEEAQENEANWFAKIEPMEVEVIDIEGKYPEDACFSELEGTTIYGVLVNERGKVRDLDLIKSSGYRIFNLQAINDIITGSYDSEIDQYKAYQVSVDFVYNQQVCPGKSISEPETIIPSTGEIESTNPEEALVEPGETISKPETAEATTEEEILSIPPETVPQVENQEVPTEEEALAEPRLNISEPEKLETPETTTEEEILSIPPETLPEVENQEVPTVEEEALAEPKLTISEPEKLETPEATTEEEVLSVPPETVPEGENQEVPTEEETLEEPALLVPKPESPEASIEQDRLRVPPETLPEVEGTLSDN